MVIKVVQKTVCQALLMSLLSQRMTPLMWPKLAADKVKTISQDDGKRRKILQK